MSTRDWVREKMPGLYTILIFLNNIILPGRFHRKSYAQFGEDLLVSHLFPTNYQGFYVDVGAHRPVQCSNTYFFYRNGWRGINIDAMPGSMKLFNNVRPQDNNIEAAISNTVSTLTYYMFNRPLQNGFYTDESLPANEGLRILHKIEMKPRKLGDLLAEKVDPKQKIDLLSIDVEGLDLSVLESNNWELYKPKVILVEVLDFKIELLSNYPVHQFLVQMGFQFYSRTVNTLIYCRNE